MGEGGRKMGEEGVKFGLRREEEEERRVARTGKCWKGSQRG